MSRRQVTVVPNIPYTIHGVRQWLSVDVNSDVLIVCSSGFIENWLVHLQSQM